MTLFLLAWVVIGIGHWVDFVVRYSIKKNLGFDVIFGLPMFILFGPITTIRKLID